MITWINSPISQKFLEILTEEIRALESQDHDFNNSAWAYHQASIVGQRQLINKIRSLFETSTRKEINNG